jgi:TatD DNase family protein
MPELSFFDAHCHLQDERYATSIAHVLERGRFAGVKAVSCCGTSENDWLAVAELAAKFHPSVIPSFGLHPWFVTDRSARWLDILEKHLVENPLSGCGEIGIDHACDPSTFAVQESVFVDQLKLAARLCRPVTLHCRKAFGRLLELLEREGGVHQGGLVHSYSGPPDLVKPLVEFGLSISFSGSVTFPKSKRAHASAAVVPHDRLCMETDSPDIRPYRCVTELNEPANIVSVAEALSRILGGWPVGDVAALTWENSCRTFSNHHKAG